MLREEKKIQDIKDFWFGGDTIWIGGIQAGKATLRRAINDIEFLLKEVERNEEKVTRC